MRKIILFFLIISILGGLYYVLLQKRFNSNLLMRENTSLIRLSDLTNFSWDKARVSFSNEDFEKITFYNRGMEVYKDNLKFDFDAGYESQYLFIRGDSMKDDTSIYQCTYTAYIKFKKVIKNEEQNRILYFYEPIGCTPILK